MEGIGILFVIAIGALIVVAIFLGWQAAKKRREALAAMAAELGWQFDPAHDRRHDDEYAHFEIFRRGHSRSAYNTLWGPFEIDGRSYPAKMGDFLYKVTSSNGKTTTTHTYRFSYLILHLPFAGVPNLFIRREGVFDKLAGLIGFDDIDFESAEFSKTLPGQEPGQALRLRRDRPAHDGVPARGQSARDRHRERAPVDLRWPVDLDAGGLQGPARLCA